MFLLGRSVEQDLCGLLIINSTKDHKNMAFIHRIWLFRQVERFRELYLSQEALLSFFTHKLLASFGLLIQFPQQLLQGVERAVFELKDSIPKLLVDGRSLLICSTVLVSNSRLLPFHDKRLGRIKNGYVLLMSFDMHLPQINSFLIQPF